MTQTNNVLLTGATGYLGIHVLRALIDQTTASITCVVRGDDDRAARARLSQLLQWYFPEVDWAQHERRFRVLAGDITEPQLGVSDASYAGLLAHPGAVINVAADVRHVGSQEHFFRMNTHSVAGLIAFARQGAGKHLHHVSTVAVRGRFLETPHIAAFSEQHLEEGQAFPEHPYAESKYRAELLLRAAFGEGFRGSAYRVGNIGPHSRTGRFQQNIQGSDFAAYLRATTRVGLAPYRPDTNVRLTPVDVMASAILTLAQSDTNVGCTYYVDSPHEVSHYDVLRVLQALGYSIRLIDAQEFAAEAAQLVVDDEALAMMLPAASLEQGVALPIDAAFSERELLRLGFEYPRVSGAWLGKFIDHAIDVDYFRAPKLWRAESLVRGLLGR